jgi:uncharacterized iron-regulated membrane protein
MTVWHRWLALEGGARSTGKSITGAANLTFLFIILSGLYLWVPRLWNRVQFRNVLWFKSGLAPKARDFNWHNVVGIWSAIPLAIVVAGALPISYPWASALVYRLAGEAPPAAAPRPGVRPSDDPGARSEPREQAVIDVAGLDGGFARATAQVPGWRTVTIRVPHGPQPSLVFTIDAGYGGQPQHRGTLTVSRATSQIQKWETFGDQSAGRRLRSWFRFAHTGEYYGLAGQTVAGLASAGGVVLVWTGVSLAWRRFTAWVAQRRSQRPADTRKAA